MPKWNIWIVPHRYERKCTLYWWMSCGKCCEPFPVADSQVSRSTFLECFKMFFFSLNLPINTLFCISGESPLGRNAYLPFEWSTFTFLLAGSHYYLLGGTKGKRCGVQTAGGGGFQTFISFMGKGERLWGLQPYPAPQREYIHRDPNSASMLKSKACVPSPRQCSLGGGGVSVEHTFSRSRKALNVYSSLGTGFSPLLFFAE